MKIKKRVKKQRRGSQLQKLAFDILHHEEQIRTMRLIINRFAVRLDQLESVNTLRGPRHETTYGSITPTKMPSSRKK